VYNGASQSEPCKQRANAEGVRITILTISRLAGLCRDLSVWHLSKVWSSWFMHALSQSWTRRKSSQRRSRCRIL